jgi:methylated-DNA-[protein]-cysteine S-methyltransferase
MGNDDCVFEILDSPVGALSIVASSRGLHALGWKVDVGSMRRDPRHPVIAATRRQLAEYFARKRRDFDLQLVLSGTEFQVRSWKALQRIPYGETISYAEQARRVGNPKATRAVGTANGRNPISIIVPCHRVVAKTGALAGFGGGLHNKKYLLALEAAP